ncbi:MAG: YkgJ family cysteine cluster protein [Candidatus Thorarchaeota archaeon]
MTNIQKICRKCGGYCCSLGGTVATKIEFNEIIKTGYNNYFVRISDNCYITEWGETGICPYFKEYYCTIYEVRPMVCKKFPVFSLNSKEHYLMHCPLTSHLSEKEKEECIALATQIPDETLDRINDYLDPYGEIIEKRMNKFEMTPIDLKQGT